MQRRKFLEYAGCLSAAAVSSFAEPGLAKSPQNVAYASAISAQPADPEHPLSLHPDNPHYFLFRGKPLVLIAATEHYGSVVNRRFNFMKYLKDAAAKKLTVTRTFLLFRELQGARNPCSPVKPDSPDYIAPWPRTGPGKAMDGEPIYDLDQWNPEYFERLHQFLTAASQLGIVVELTVFSNTYADGVWALNPLRAQNNKQKVGNVEWQEYTSLRNPELLARQEAYARKIIQETCNYDNIYYEICNEPGGGEPGHVTPADVDAWQQKMAGILRHELASHNRHHLIFGQNAFRYAPSFQQSFDDSFAGSMLDAVNVHPLPNLVYRNKTYELGNFMSKELQLEQFRAFFLATASANKPSISDEDNCASIYRDDDGWTIHRKRAWMAVMCGAHYDYIDFSITTGSEAGTKESRAKIRSWMQLLSAFIHSVDFIHARPDSAFLTNTPDHLVAGTLAVPGSDYIVYLADARELTDPSAGQPIGGMVSLTLPSGEYHAALFSPVTGMYSPPLRIQGRRQVAVELLPFEHDIVLRIRRV
ncbi:MAG: cellulase family glycosylhydrolase [Acidobacteriota bacterium]|nr:cellulase family glycosylhydrolase [Acidobacteriota bacterium]